MNTSYRVNRHKKFFSMTPFYDMDHPPFGGLEAYFAAGSPRIGKLVSAEVVRQPGV